MDPEIRTFLDHLRLERGLSENTATSYARDLDDFSRYLAREQRTMRDADRTVVLRYLSDLKRRGMKSTTIARRMSALRSFFRYLLREGVLQADPTANIEVASPDEHLPRVVSEEDVERLIGAVRRPDAMGLRDRAMLETLYATGMRVSELVALSLEDVELAAGFIRVFGKGKKERVVPLGEIAQDALGLYLRYARPLLVRDRGESAVFLNRLGRRMTRQGFWNILKGYARQAGVSAEVTPHTLRHSFATHLLEGGADLRVVQELLGHAPIPQLSSTIQMRRLSNLYPPFVITPADAHCDTPREACAV